MSEVKSRLLRLYNIINDTDVESVTLLLWRDIVSIISDFSTVDISDEDEESAADLYRDLIGLVALYDTDYLTSVVPHISLLENLWGMLTELDAEGYFDGAEEESFDADDSAAWNDVVNQVDAITEQVNNNTKKLHDLENQVRSLSGYASTPSPAICKQMETMITNKFAELVHQHGLTARDLQTKIKEITSDVLSAFSKFE